MYVYMYVCSYVYIYIYVYMYRKYYTYICIYILIYVYMYVYTHVHIYPISHLMVYLVVKTPGHEKAEETMQGRAIGTEVLSRHYLYKYISICKHTQISVYIYRDKPSVPKS